MIYLDNAATTFPKPPCMLNEISRCINTYCGNPGRSGHVLSEKAAEKIFECRETLADFFGSDKPENVVFTMNTTYALNFAVKSLYKHGMHVLISNLEHNSVFRPIFTLAQSGEISYSIFDATGSVPNILLDLESKLRPDTGMLVMLHASNIYDKILPIREIGEFCRKHNLIFIVDAAQSAGVQDIDMQKCHIDALCAPAHKGLYGPQGLGFVIFGEKTLLRTVLEGGNGVYSLSAQMGNELPESMEPGTSPTPLIAGLAATLQWVKRIGLQAIRLHESSLASLLTERLYSIPGSVIFTSDTPSGGLVLYKNKRLSVQALSDALNAQNICARSGFHCAPLAHLALHTGEQGAVRFSFGVFNTKKEVDTLYSCLKNICK